MLAVSRALMLRPKLLLLDEPSFGLAPLIVREIFEIMRRINEDDGVSMLLVADAVVVLETGRVAMAGSAADIQRDASVRRAYLGS